MRIDVRDATESIIHKTKKMKKIIVVLVIAVSVFSYMQISDTKNTELNALMLENIDAMASGEIVGSYCAIGPGICCTDDGYCMMGVRIFF